jgi:hypothetical protein
MCGRRWPLLGILAFMVLALTVPAETSRAEIAPSSSVFPLLIVDRATQRPIAEGTAFFITADGEALTASHVVNLPQHDPAHYQLVAIVGGELYDVAISCASPIAGIDPRHIEASTHLTRDVAHIRVAAVSVPMSMIGLSGHTGPLPVFDPLPLFIDGETVPANGIAVQIVGYRIDRQTIAQQPQFVPGVVTGSGLLEDGTGMLVLSASIGPGMSGGPVLDPNGQVVGMVVRVGTGGDAKKALAMIAAFLTPGCEGHP